MKNILVPIGSHSNALNTLQYAINFAESVQARIYFIHIFSSSKIAGNVINIDSILVRDSKKLLNIRARFVASCIIDEDGKRLFTAQDIVPLGKKSAAAMSRVFDECREINGITEKDVEEIEGN